MKKVALGVCIQFILFTGCGYLIPYKGVYKVALHSVDRYVGAEKIFGDYRIAPVKEKKGHKAKKNQSFEEEVREYRYHGSIKKYHCENKMLKMLWIVLPKKLEVTLKNKTNYPIKILWDKALFIDQDGNSGGVLHTGIRDFLRNNPQPPTVVAPKARIKDIIIPQQNLYYENGDFSGWRVRPLFPNEARSDRKLKKLSEQYVGKSVQVILPIQIGNMVNDYSFNFKVEGFLKNFNYW